jgi:hypothetical protein
MGQAAFVRHRCVGGYADGVAMLQREWRGGTMPVPSSGAPCGKAAFAKRGAQIHEPSRDLADSIAGENFRLPADRQRNG